MNHWLGLFVVFLIQGILNVDETVDSILDQKLLGWGEYSLYVRNIVSLVLFIAAVYVVVYIVRRLVYRSKRLDVSKKYTVNALIRYVIVVIAFVISLHLLGIDITVLLAGSAALLVGIGFGLQYLFYDILSGIILLLDATVKVGDVIEINDKIYKVVTINFRTTTVIGRDENYVILPNSEITGNRVINWTHDALASRFKINVGVSYSTDVVQLRQVLLDVANQNQHILKDPAPFVRFEEFGDSSLNFSLIFYSHEVFRIETVKSDLRFQIFEALGKNHIEIPFPQRVVHMMPNSEPKTDLK